MDYVEIPAAFYLSECQALTLGQTPREKQG